MRASVLGRASAAPLQIDLQAGTFDQQIVAVPPVAGIYLLRAPGKPPHISWSLNLQRRLKRLLGTSVIERQKTIGWLREGLQFVECWPVGSKLESSLLMYELTKSYFPSDYLFRLRLRMPWFVALMEGEGFPRLAVVNRMGRNCRLVFGPFASRDAAQAYEAEVLGLFQMRRCTETLAPVPDHPGCIYGEMNQCLRPCQCAVTAEEYASEVGRVTEFMTTNGRSSIAVLETARDRAASDTDFEQAAQIHKRIEKLRAAAGLRDSVITDIDSFSGIALTRSREAQRFCLWPMLEGFWQEPLELQFPSEGFAARSLDQDLRERLTHALAHPRKTGKRIEETAIFSRWYYSSWRDGEWFPLGPSGNLNYRKLVRDISKLAKTANT